MARNTGCGGFYALVCVINSLICIAANGAKEASKTAQEGFVGPVETTCTTSATTTTTMVTSATTVTETSEETVATTYDTEFTDTMTYLGQFTATYFKGSVTPCNGGSGRMLVSCYEKETSYKGSVASKFVFDRYGYYVNDKTMVYIEFENYPRLDGWYSVDDYNADPGIVDFYFSDYSTCPWQNDGVTDVEMWIGG